MKHDESGARLQALKAELRAEKAAKELTYDDIAERSDMQKMTVHRYMSGTRDIPMGKLLLMCDALGVDVSALIERAEQRFRQA